MASGFKDKDGKFRPTGNTKSTKRKKAQKTVSVGKGTKLNSGVKKPTLQQELVEMPLLKEELESEQRLERIPEEFRGIISDLDVLEWEAVGDSKIVDIKEEDFEGMLITTVVFENGDEWFEFDKAKDENRFVNENFEKQVHSGKFDNDIDLQDHLFIGDTKKFGRQVSTDMKDINEFDMSPAKSLKRNKISIDNAVKNGMIHRSHMKLKDHFVKNGKLLPIEHPKIEGYTDLLSGEAFFEKRMN